MRKRRTLGLVLGITVFMAAFGVEIYKMTSTGANPTRLTNNAAFDYDPAWSPVGAQIAFNSDRDGDVDVYVMDAVDTSPADGNGDNLVQITNNPGDDQWPAWSPNGTQFVLGSNSPGTFEIFTMPSTGGSQTNISNHPASDLQPDWNPSPGP